MGRVWLWSKCEHDSFVAPADESYTDSEASPWRRLITVFLENLMSQHHCDLSAHIGCFCLDVSECFWPGFISWLLPSSGLQFDSSLVLLPSFSAVLSNLVYRIQTKGHVMEATVQDSVCHTVCLIQGVLATFCTFIKYSAGEKKQEPKYSEG